MTACLPLMKQGIVTHVTDVKPLIEVVTYTDQENGNEVYQEVRNWRMVSSSRTRATVSPTRRAWK